MDEQNDDSDSLLAQKIRVTDQKDGQGVMEDHFPIGGLALLSPKMIHERPHVISELKDVEVVAIFNFIDVW